MNDNQLLRYSRHILMDDFGIEGQKVIGRACIDYRRRRPGFAGAVYLASAGVGKITLADNDTVDLTNLQRQIMHDTAKVGAAKAVSGKQTLERINPEIEVVALQERLSGARLDELVGSAQVVLDAATISPRATPLIAPVSRVGCPWCRARRSSSTARSACSIRAAQRRPAMPACFRRSRTSRKRNVR